MSADFTKKIHQDTLKNVDSIRNIFIMFYILYNNLYVGIQIHYMTLESKHRLTPNKGPHTHQPCNQHRAKYSQGLLTLRYKEDIG